MAAFPPEPFKINNKWWIDVTNQTVGSPVFNLEEAIAYSYGSYISTSGPTLPEKEEEAQDV